jgi:hypothetical protein
MGRTYVVKRRTIPSYGRGAFFNAHQRCRIEPGMCIIARSVARLKNIYFQIFKLNGFLLSIAAHVVLDQINPALNREGVELPFNQSY